MKSKKERDVKRKFGNNLLNNENVINLQNDENHYNNANKNNNINIISKKNQIHEKIKKNISIIPLKNLYNETKYNINILIKNPSKNNPEFLEEYFQDLIQHINFTVSQNILDYSTHNIFCLQDILYINQEKRKFIIESIIYQSFLWKLNPDSAYLMVNIMDRYIHKNRIKNNEYELIGLASFLIATKYEDIYAPDAQTLTKIFSYKYHYEDILDTERKILKSLDYCILYTSSYKILNLLYYLSNIENIHMKNFAGMFLEMSLTDLDLLKYSQIKRAIGCFILSKKIFGIKSGNNFIKFLFSYDEKEMENIVKKILRLSKDIVLIKEQQNLIAEKYRSARFNSIFNVFENKIKEKMEKKKDIK